MNLNLVTSNHFTYTKEIKCKTYLIHVCHNPWLHILSTIQDMKELEKFWLPYSQVQSEFTISSVKIILMSHTLLIQHLEYKWNLNYKPFIGVLWINWSVKIKIINWIKHHSIRTISSNDCAYFLVTSIVSCKSISFYSFYFFLHNT